MIKITLAFLFVSLAGCSASTQQYYEAVQKTAEANAVAAQAKFDALSAIASSGDGQAASAAVMALAMTNTQSAQPLPQQSEALQWGAILAAPVSSLGMMWIQADSAKKVAEYNSQVDLARVNAESADNQALYGAFVNTASAGYTAMGNVDYTPFVNGMVTLGTNGINSNVDIATLGFNTADSISTTGFNVANNLGAAGMSNLANVSAAGMTAIQTVGTKGFDALNASSAAWLTYSASRDTTFAGMMATEQSGCIATANAEGQVVVTCN
tara:strand:+ start:1528 stop:2331 length:804 start_codon:yes stop_codon:yes gene_type:complete